ncbi:uncharacterized protein LOC114356677 isoform X2 [Ostrinia furnacalis]|uniref:uncharacterized protein LOC114356677 isoform X1 n=1 Tax=Ostrinia furnacalis TaxID=93504 RepID=UPI00103FAA0B|nr:uncharacterized protein LOC114356677 isoform X1 [Ostrinia furnacalis]XP_028165783.1 uncharacterized protein LOC114356677 isoform X1 [Ostrinia furnacalis]XP_028165784.1 uncharacterized protein LOC114356677 isoform X2 [Ostrinia furnacalis]
MNTVQMHDLPLRKRGRPRGHKRTPLTKEQQKERNKFYEAQRRADIAENWAELAKMVDPNKEIKQMRYKDAANYILDLQDKVLAVEKEAEKQRAYNGELRAKLAELQEVAAFDYGHTQDFGSVPFTEEQSLTFSDNWAGLGMPEPQDIEMDTSCLLPPPDNNMLHNGDPVAEQPACTGVAATAVTIQEILDYDFETVPLCGEEQQTALDIWTSLEMQALSELQDTEMPELPDIHDIDMDSVFPSPPATNQLLDDVTREGLAEVDRLVALYFNS